MRVSTVLKKAALISFVIILSILPYRLFSQTTGSIGGTVVDASDNKTPLQGAYIHIEGTSKGAESDANGNYIILNVEVGTFTVTCKYLGYTDWKQEQVKVYVDSRTNLNFALTNADKFKTPEIVIIDVKRPVIDITSPEDRKNILKETIDNEGIRGIQNIVGNNQV